MTETQIRKFLKNALFYAASGLDDTPIRHCASRFNNFIYVDYSRKRQAVLQKLLHEGLGDYVLASEADAKELPANLVLGRDWLGIPFLAFGNHPGLPENWHEIMLQDPFVLQAQMCRRSGANAPNKINFMFIPFEACATYGLLFTRRHIAPRCVAHIRCGVGFGGNFSGYPSSLGLKMTETREGIPQYILHDHLCRPDYGDYLILVEAYDPIKQWIRTTGEDRGQPLTLRELNSERYEEALMGELFEPFRQAIINQTLTLLN